MGEEYKKLNETLDTISKELNEIMKKEYGFLVPVVNEDFSRLPATRLKRNASQMYRPISKEKIVGIVLNFYKQLDPDYYQMAKDILINNKDSNISIVLYDEKTKELLPDDFEFPKYSNDGSKLLTRYDILQIGPYEEPHTIQTNQGKIYVELKGNIKDAYTLTHELAHVMDFNPNKRQNETRLLFNEITSTFMEYLLNDYLEKEGLITEKEKYTFLFKQYESNKIDADINNLRIKLAERKEKDGDLKKEDLEDVLKENQYKFDESFLPACIKGICGFKREPLMTRYILATLVSSYLHSAYLKNPEKAMKMERNIVNAIKEDDFTKIFPALGLELNKESIYELCVCKNQQLKLISRKLNFKNEKEVIER